DSMDVEGLSIGLALMGKATVVSSFCGIFIYSSELFPTVLRTVANGTCAFWLVWDPSSRHSYFC
ncbi:Uncharacterized protein FKW44_017116, partial [Caligus rogercresseyi]